MKRYSGYCVSWDGYDHGSCSGSGNGHGFGDGDGYNDGFGSGDGHGTGDGYGSCSGSGNGHGIGDGDGYDDGFGYCDSDSDGDSACSQFAVKVHPDGTVSVGCQRHSPQEWLRVGKRLAAKHGCLQDWPFFKASVAELAASNLAGG